MEKTVVIDGKEVQFKSTGGTALRYKAQFGKDYFSEILKLKSLEKLGNLNQEEISSDDLQGLDFEVFYNIAWTMAKTANKDIPDPLTWLDSFDEFPMIEIIPDLQNMILASIQSKKK